MLPMPTVPVGCRMASRSENFRILIVGCGELGSRHLQAVAAVPSVREIEIVDSRPEALALGRARLAEVAGTHAHLKVRWLASIAEATPGGDLCIVATQAAGRCGIVRAVSSEFGYKNFLIEKIVAQSVADYQELLAYAGVHQLSVWVNFKTRAHPSHRRVKEHLHASEPLIFSAFGGNHGLANNGIHVADLFLFLDESTGIEVVSAVVDERLHPSKRGPTIHDLSGTIFGKSAKGSSMMISFAGHHNSPVHFSIVSPRYRAVVDDQKKCFFESTPETDWVWKSIPFEENLAVSYMTTSFVDDILLNHKCELPTLQESFPAHQFILSVLSPHFERLHVLKDGRCPVT